MFLRSIWVWFVGHKNSGVTTATGTTTRAAGMWALVQCKTLNSGLAKLIGLHMTSSPSALLSTDLGYNSGGNYGYIVNRYLI